MHAPESASVAPRVWDLPTRLFHWALVGLFACSWWTHETGQMDRHRWSGLTLLGLLAFRLIWGLVGGSTARFAGFVKGPRAVMATWKGVVAPTPGHSAPGGWSVIALLALLCVQVGTGLFAVDVDGLESGPLSDRVEFDSGRFASHIHGLTFNLLLALIALHVVAIGIYRLRGRNLLLPMLTGRDRELAGEPGMVRAPWWRFLVAAAVAGALAWWISGGAHLG